MKSTLFNIMLGCLAALSLAGCGNSSKGDGHSSSSSVPGLLNSGSTSVTLQGTMGNTYLYTIRLERTGDCLISTMGDVDTFMGAWQDFKGSWKDMTDSTNSFKIQFIGPFEAVGFAPPNVGITTVDTVELRLPEGALENYRSDNVVTGASFNVAPFTYTSQSGTYNDTANKDAITVTPEP